MTKYRLALLSGVPHATLSNICSGQACIEKCTAETLYKLAKVTGDESIKCSSLEQSIPEFKNFNIAENEVRQARQKRN